MIARAEVRGVIEQLLRGTGDGNDVSLDAIGDAIGTRPFSTDDIDQVIEGIESAGRQVTWAKGGGTDDLRRVITVARLIQKELGRRATIGEIAARAALEPRAVRTALTLARVMAR